MAGFTDGLAGSLVSAVGQLINTGAQNRANRKINREQNAFNAEQSRLNREFQSQEAQIARDWQEQQYLEYSSPQAMVRQYKDAGLNPALMYGSNLQGSTGSSPSPSGSAASGSAIPAQAANLTGIIGEFLGLAKLHQDIKESESRSNANNAAAEKSRSDISVNSQTILESRQKIAESIERTKSESTKRALMAAQELVSKMDSELKGKQSISLTYDNLKKEFAQAYKQKFGFYPENNAYQLAAQIFGQGVAEIEYFGSQIGNFVKNFFK